MRASPAFRGRRGQALSEMILSIPLLFLFAAGIFQFGILFLSQVQFEHACGEATRLYAAGLTDKDHLGPRIQENLGAFRSYFDMSTLRVQPQRPRSPAAALADNVQSGLSMIPFVSKIEGCEWSVQVQCKPPFLFSIIFPKGVPFHTTLQVHRYPR